MNISWVGHSCFKIEGKSEGDTITIVTDPYTKESGLHLPKLKADILTVSHYHDDHSNIEAVSGVDERGVFIVDRPGEYEVKGAFVIGIGAYHDRKEGKDNGKSTIFRIELEGLSIVHLGDLGTDLSDRQLSKIGDVDILLIPVGGKDTLGAKDAAEAIRQIEPRIVIPMHYKVAGLKADIAPLDGFVREMGGKVEKMPKLKIMKKDLGVEELKVIVLEQGV